MKFKNKKGSHISLVLSFIIFSMSLIFVYIIMTSAVTNPSTKSNTLDIIKSNVLERISEEVWVIRAYNSSLSGNCIELNNPGELGGVAVAFDSGENPMGTQMDGDKILVESEGGFFKVLYSNYFQKVESSFSGCSHLQASSVIKENKILQMKIEELMNQYLTNYSNLKEELSVPLAMDIGLIFEDQNGIRTGEVSRTPQTEIYSEELKITYLTMDGLVERGTLWIKIW